MGDKVRQSTRSPAEPHRDAPIGGRYRLETILGEGAMGSVFRAVDVASGDRLALKRLRLDGREEEHAHRALLRFRREFHTMAQLRHPSIVRVFDFGQDAEGAYYTMELLEGTEAQQLAPVSPMQACTMLRDVASALAFLHARRVLHRDIAPRNVQLGADGRARLIDFGVVATCGVMGEVVGTPTCVPPEAVRGMPLDHRSDLYGLGALGYFLLTGAYPYPAHSVYELESLWTKRPTPPSTYRSGIPAALDSLVMSLLSLDPLGRPTSAAEVIDRLTGIGRLPANVESEAAVGWLRSTTMVGRQREMETVRRTVRSANRGEGGVVWVEAPNAMGKSRLLREAGLEGQLAGAMVLRADGQDIALGPYAVLRELAAHAMRAYPDDAREAAADHLPMIDRIIPELRARGDDSSNRRASVPPAAPTDEDPTQQRVEQQRHLLEWLVGLSERRPVVLLIDDLQRCDEASGAVLATVAHSAPTMSLALIVGLRSDEPIHAPGPIAAIREAAQRVRLRGLSRREVEQLVCAMFGEVRHADVLAQSMHRLTGGAPLHCQELARHFVDRGVVRYDGGTWLLPPRIDESDVPHGLAEAMNERIAGLSPGARALGEALAIQGGDISLELCVALAGGDEVEVFAALDSLVLDEVLVGNGDSYHFRHDGLRKALLSHVDARRQQALHLRAAEALLSSEAASAEHEAQVGWHFERGGDPARAAEYLERAGRRLYEARSFSDSIGPLEAALHIREEQGSDPTHRIKLRQMLMRAGVLCDRNVVLRYADETIALLRDVSGMQAASRLMPWLGRLVALALGLGWAWVRWLFRSPRRRGPKPVESLTTLITLAGYAASVHSLSFDLDRLRPLREMLEPLSVLRGRVPRGAYLLVDNFYRMAVGHFAHVRRNTVEMLDILERDHLTPLSDIDRRMGLGGSLYMRASAAATVQDPSYEEDLAALDDLDLRFFEAAARMDRLFFHRLRGDEEHAEQLREETEVLFMQLGNVWVFESQIQWLSTLAYGLTRDVVGLKRCIDAFDRLVREGHRLEPWSALARSEYLRERGQPSDALRVLSGLLAKLPPEQSFIRQHAFAALAETHLALEDVDLAKHAAQQGLAIAEDPEAGLLPVRVRCGRAMAIAEAVGGDTGAASRRLEALIDEAAGLGSPSLSGSLHEARASIALQAGDTSALYAHYAETESWFRSTRNPALIARVERLAKLLEAQSAHHPPGVVSALDAVTALDIHRPAERVASALAGARDSQERATRLLELLVAESAAARGFFFLVEDGELTLCAPSDVSAPEYIVAEMERLCRTIASGVTRSHPQTFESASADEPGAWLPVVLIAGDDPGRPDVVGAAALVGGSFPLTPPSQELVRELAESLRSLDRDKLAAS